MKTQSQQIADMIARGETIEETEFKMVTEVIESVMMLVMFVFFMALIMYVGTAVGY